jgi:hypothetical protein
MKALHSSSKKNLYMSERFNSDYQKRDRRLGLPSSEELSFLQARLIANRRNTTSSYKKTQEERELLKRMKKEVKNV